MSITPPAWHPSVAPKPKPPERPVIPQDPVSGKFIKGHPGRPAGSRNNVTIASENILIDEFERITRKCVELALAGDPTALKICFDRLYPPRRGRTLPRLKKAEGEGTVNALLRAVLDGEITPTEGTEVVNLIESAARVAAVQALADMRREQLEALNRVRGGGGGVLVVPVAEMSDWESIAVETQRQLKGKIKE